MTASVYLTCSDLDTNYAQWKENIMSKSEKRPYEKQWLLLDEVHKTLLEEARLEQEQKLFTNYLLRLIHGLPGSGKSQLMKWVRAFFFEEVLQWRHNVEFVFIASMNTMVALIDGVTIHSFGDILVDPNKRHAKKSCASWSLSSTVTLPG